MNEDGCRPSKINKTQIKNLAELGMFSLGLSYLLYFFIQYFLAPLCCWLIQDIKSLGWMNDVFYLFEQQKLEVYTIQSLYYSSLAIIAFVAGHYFLPAKLVIIKHELIVYIAITCKLSRSSIQKIISSKDMGHGAT